MKPTYQHKQKTYNQIKVAFCELANSFSEQLLEQTWSNTFINVNNLQKRNTLFIMLIWKHVDNHLPLNLFINALDLTACCKIFLEELTPSDKDQSPFNVCVHVYDILG